jgi:hypothetical protein
MECTSREPHGFVPCGAYLERWQKPVPWLAFAVSLLGLGALLAVAGVAAEGAGCPMNNPIPESQ